MCDKFIDRLQLFMETRGINDNQMTIAAGLSVGLLGKLKKNGKGMNSSNIEKILSVYTELSADWLLTGRGEMLRESCDISGNVVGNISAKHSGSVRVSQSTCDQSETIEALRAHLAEKERTIQIQQQLIEALKK